MEKDLYGRLENITNIDYRENYNYETRIWSSGYVKAMEDIKRILREFEKTKKNR